MSNRVGAGEGAHAGAHEGSRGAVSKSGQSGSRSIPPGRRTRGRPSKLTLNTITCIVSSIARGASRARAAKDAGVDERTLRLWRRRGRESKESGQHRYLLGQMDAAETRKGRPSEPERRTPSPGVPKPSEPLPREVRAATIAVERDGTFMRMPLEIDLPALKQFYEATIPAGAATGLNPDGSSVWLLLRRGRPGYRSTMSIMGLIAHQLRVEVIDEHGVPCVIEFRPSGRTE